MQDDKWNTIKKCFQETFGMNEHLVNRISKSLKDKVFTLQLISSVLAIPARQSNTVLDT